MAITQAMATSFTTDEVEQLSRSIKVFLNSYSDLDKVIPPKHESQTVQKPRWLQKSNFLCLLNVPSIISRYGPIRNYWEGSIIGEKFLQLPKGEQETSNGA